MDWPWPDTFPMSSRCVSPAARCCGVNFPRQYLATAVHLPHATASTFADSGSVRSAIKVTYSLCRNELRKRSAAKRPPRGGEGRNMPRNPAFAGFQTVDNADSSAQVSSSLRGWSPAGHTGSQVSGGAHLETEEPTECRSQRRNNEPRRNPNPVGAARRPIRTS